MIKLEVIYRHLESDPKINEYLKKHIAKLDKYLPKHAKKSAHAVVRISAIKIRSAYNFECEVTLHLPSENIIATEIANNVFSSIDMVEPKLKSQIAKYKQQNANSHSSRRQRILRKVLRSSA